jgi:YihY family inner membrane protein
VPSDLVDRVDDFQRRHVVVGFPLAVVYKFFDDQGPYLAAILTYYAFVAIVPILLIASSVLGFFLQGNEELYKAVLNSALGRFPIVGTQLGEPEGLTGSRSAIIIGSLAALYGALGLATAAQHALNTAWAVPRNSRFNPFVGRFRAFITLLGAGIAVLGTSLAAVFLNNLDGMLGTNVDAWISRIGTLLGIALTAVVLSLMMRYTTARRPSFRKCLPGGITIALLWHGLQIGGGAYVKHVINRASDMNGVFALVLGLLGLLFLACSFAVIGVEVSVVTRERLYPRALLTPFTDAVELTEADRRAYVNYAKALRHKGFQQIEVTFHDRDRPDQLVRHDETTVSIPVVREGSPQPEEPPGRRIGRQERDGRGGRRSG